MPALALLVIVAGMVLGARLAGPIEQETSIGVVSFELSPAFSGEAEAYVPLADWGFRADAFSAPFKLRAELRSIDRPALLSVAAGDRELIDKASDELRTGAEVATARAALWGVGTTALLAAVAILSSPWLQARRRLFLGLLAGITLIAGIGVGIRAVASFDVASFERPTYYARGSELAQILAVAERERSRDGYSSSVDRTLRSFSTYLTGTGEVASGGRDLILASDIHNNSLVLGPLGNFAGDDPVVLAGDFGNDGSETEAKLLAPQIAELSEDVLAVSGNHDSLGLMETLAGSGVEVLTDDGLLESGGGVSDSPLLEVDGLLFAGYADPLQWEEADPSDPERIFSFSELPGGGEAEQQAAYADIAIWFDGLPERPDVVVVHQNGIAQDLARQLWERGETEPLTILTGHDHKQHVDRYGSIVVVDGGTVGAGGVFGAGDEFAGLAQLHFDIDEPILRSVDLIRAEPLSGRAQAERVVVDTLCEQNTVEPELEQDDVELCSSTPAESAGSAAEAG